MRPRTDAFLVTAVLALGLAAPSAHAAFGVSSFTARATDAADHDVGQAGAHPFFGITKFTFNNTLGIPDGQIKNIRVDLPPGLISNPQATPRCTNAQFPSCPPNTQVGTETLTTTLPVPITENVYNMETTADQVSVFAFDTPFGRTDIVGGVRDDSDYGLFFTISNVPQIASLVTSELKFWGVPSQHSGGASTVPFISLPTECGVEGTTKLTAESWAGETVTATATSAPATGCDQVPFDPSISVTPGTTQADEPTSAAVGLHVPQSSDGATLATAHVRDVSVTLPEGMTINPAAATGLEGCSDATACPAASKVGTVAIATPVLPAPLTGSVYLGEPLPADPYRLFVEATGFGITVRLAGSVHPDPQTGRLTATFAGTPRVPFTDFTLTFSGGPAATLATPLSCGTATTTSALKPYSGQPAATPSTSFTVDADGSGGACPPAPFSLGFAAGTQDSRAGAFSPFTVTVTRADRQKLLSRLSIRQPPGLLGRLASVPLCGEADAAGGTCPESSRVGTSSVKSGAGPQPFALSGPVYLTGPYAGAPFGLAIAIRALAGPFDLGTVVVRAAIRVDSGDSHLTIDADPLPQILQGIPLRLREVTVVVDREGFIFNPSTCDQLAIHGTLTAVDGTVQEADAPFQATGCDALAFTPKLTAVADGKSSAKAGAGLKVTLEQPPGQSNVRSVSVRLPKRLAANGTTLAKACLAAAFHADPSSCAASQVGTVRASTPLLSGPLGGPVYLVAQGATLPSLEALLRGEGLDIGLSATITYADGSLSSTFASVPDVPITSFVLDLPKGPHSALSAGKGLCGGALTMPTTIVGQNGTRIDRATPIAVTGCGLKILRARVKKSVATLTVEVSRPGRLSGHGIGMGWTSRPVTQGGNVQLKMRLSKYGKRLRVRRHRAHRHLKVRVIVRQGKLTARRTVVFR
jgi:hypothetical protein